MEWKTPNQIGRLLMCIAKCYMLAAYWITEASQWATNRWRLHCIPVCMPCILCNDNHAPPAPRPLACWPTEGSEARKISRLHEIIAYMNRKYGSSLMPHRRVTRTISFQHCCTAYHRMRVILAEYIFVCVRVACERWHHSNVAVAFGTPFRHTRMSIIFPPSNKQNIELNV